MRGVRNQQVLDRERFCNEARKRLELFTYDELADILEVTKPTVARLFNRGVCSVDTMLAICRFCKLNPMSYLLKEGVKC